MAGSESTAQSPEAQSLDLLDRVAVAYIALPVALFVLGWFRLWVSIPLIALMLLPARVLLRPLPSRPRFPVLRCQVLVAVALGSVWVYFSGIAHFVYANLDWYTRDAVLHDLVVAHWPVVYQTAEGANLLLRAPLGFYMPAAVIGKLLGLPSAHFFMAFWAATGAVVFLLQAMSLGPARIRQAFGIGLIVIFFSGLDFVGSALNWGPRFFTTYDITSHIEWWAGSYQYSAMTTQLFWVPNHALAAWVLMGLLARSPGVGDVDRLLPVLLVCAVVWSPLSAIGTLPFAAARLFVLHWRSRLAFYLQPDALLPALLAAVLIGTYFSMDTGGINRGMTLGAQADGDFISPILSQFQFFLFEAGFIGAAILAIRWSAQVVVALVVLLLLPVAHLGPGNDLVMRASIPSLVALLFGCCYALLQEDLSGQLRTRKRVLSALLLLGSITAVHEWARALLLPSWPANLHSSLIAVNCGAPPHYIARVMDQPIWKLMKPTESMLLEDEGRKICLNPAWEVRELREQKRSLRNRN